MEQRDHIVSLMYEAAVNPGLWPTALAAFADATESDDLTLALGNSTKAGPPSQAKLIVTAGRWAPSVPASFIAYYWKINPMADAIDRTSEGELLVCQEHIDDDQVSRSEYYQDFLIASGGRYQGGWVLENNAKHQITLALHRRKARFEREELAAWESVAQHARHAVSLGAALRLAWLAKSCFGRLWITNGLSALWSVRTRASSIAPLPRRHCWRAAAC